MSYLKTLKSVHVNQVGHVWYRNFVIFKRTWLVSVFWILLEPLFMLGAIGFGLGSFVKTVGGFSYVEFFFPGLICTSIMMVAFFEGSYGNFSKLIYSKVYSAQLLSPVTDYELIIGDIFWGATKGTLSGLGIILVGLSFGLGWSWGQLPVLLMLFLNAWIFSCLGMIVTSWVQNFDQIIYPTSGLIVPMSLFSGTYFPLDDLHPALKGLFYLLPLTHVVEVVRALLLGGLKSLESPIIFAHIGFTLAVALILTRVAVHRMVRRLSI